LEGDRAASLTIRSAAMGIVDYSKARLQDTTWWRYWRYMLQEVENQSDQKLLRLAFDFHLGLISNSNLSADDFKKIQKELMELFKDYEGNLRPWLGRNREDRYKDMAKDFKEQWKAAAGFDPDDPVALAKWENALTKQREDTEKTHLKNQTVIADQDKQIQQRLQEIKQKRARQQGRP
jgi:hypothetical protein